VAFNIGLDTEWRNPLEQYTLKTYISLNGVNNYDNSVMTSLLYIPLWIGGMTDFVQSPTGAQLFILYTA